MAGRLVASGQTFVVEAMKYYIDNVATNLYIGLMKNTTTPSESYQLGAGITEITPTGVGYCRNAVGSWGITRGNDPILSGSMVTYNITSTWSDVQGYFVCQTSGGNDILWAEVFPAGKGGTKYSGDTINIIPSYEQMYKGEV
jgi:hypothetical protein